MTRRPEHEEGADAPESSPAAGARRPYASPKLKPLGSVHVLLGKSGGALDRSRVNPNRP